MLNLKKTAVAVLALTSSAVFAGTMGPVCVPGAVTIPCESTAWDIGGQALYLQSTLDGPLGYVGSLTTAPGTTTYYNANNSWGWGFKIEGSYHFYTGNDINVNWYHYNRSRTRNYNVTDIIGSEFPAFTASQIVTFNTKPQWDAVNIEFGQHVLFGDMKHIRFHGGAQFARVQANLRATYVSTPATDPLFPGSNSIVSNNRYNGFGPRVGADMSFDWGNGFSMYANGAAAVLAGTQKFYQTGPQTFVNNGSKNQIVPELEGKLGLSYGYNLAQGVLGFDVGYMWVDYIHPINRAAVEYSNFGIQGLYFGLKYVGNV